MIRLPAVTRRTAVASTGVLVDAATARDWVGGDSSHDTMLANMILTAQEETEAYLGVALGETTYTDLYPAWCRGDRLIASAPYSAAPVVAIVGANGAGAQLAPPGDYAIDRTGERPAVIPLASLRGWEYAENPVSIEYATSIAESPELVERIQNSILMRVGILFESRGTVPAPGWERAWQSTLPRVFR